MTSCLFGALFVYVLAVALTSSPLVALGDAAAVNTTNEPVKMLQKIVGGTAATAGQLPYQVQLKMNSASSTYLCGGTIVSRYIVVSAAHCFYGHDITSGTVYAGSILMYGSSGTGQSSRMASLWIHPQYSSSTKYNDLSIITLSTPFTFNSYVAAMPLAAPSATFAAGIACTVSGWGVTSSGGSSSNTLLYASVKIVSQSSCATTWTSLPSTGICTSTTTTDTCQGDSGGPVICSGTARDGTTTKVLAGIVSYGSGCASGHPAVNTRVSSYSDFIYNYLSYSTAATLAVATTTSSKTSAAHFCVADSVLLLVALAFARLAEVAVLRAFE